MTDCGPYCDLRPMRASRQRHALAKAVDAVRFAIEHRLLKIASRIDPGCERCLTCHEQYGCLPF